MKNNLSAMQIKIYHTILNFFTRIFPLLILVSCVVDHDLKPKTIGNGESEITFTLQLPDKNAAVLRSLSEKDENEVDEINILVFKPHGGEHVYTARCSGADITTDNSNSRLKTFTVKLRQGNFDVVILANAHTVVTSASLQGMPKNEALTGITATIPADGIWPVDDFKPFPMWGDVGNITIDDHTALTGDKRIKLTRMVARIDVQVTNESSNNFKLTSVDIYNYNTEGTLVPKETDWDNTTDPDKPKVTAPHVPPASTPAEGPAQYKGTSIDEAENKCAGKIYLFEAENHSNAIHTVPKALTARTCLVIGGIWDAGGNSNFTGRTTYYRMDFSEGSGASQKYLDVLRNHHYLFNITKISGHGYDDSYTAFVSEPVHIEANVLEWNDADLSDIVFNGQNYLSVTPGIFEFSSNERLEGVKYEDNILYIKTDYKASGTHTGSGWYVERIVDAADEGTEVDWLTLTPNKGDPDTKTTVVLTFDENNSPEVRSAIVFIAAGRLRYPVQVTQSFTPGTGLNIYDPLSGNPLNILSFETKAGEDPGEKRFRVDWKPVTSTLFVISSGMGTSDFPSGGTTGTPVTGTVNNGTGTMEYAIKPPAISTDDIDPSKGGDPFLTKVSNINFSITSEASFVSKSIMLRQIHYNLLADYNQSGYRLNGSEYTIPVRCNSEWMVSGITGDTDILADQNGIMKQAGGYNTTTGDLLKVKVVPMSEDGSHDGKTAYIHLKEVNDKCPPLTIAFKGIECGIDGVASPMKIGDEGYDNTGDGRKTYLTHMYTGKCWMVQNSKEGNPGRKQYTGSPRPLEGERGYYYNYLEVPAMGCPAGWRFPTESEFRELVAELEESATPGKKWWMDSDYMAGYANSSASITWDEWGNAGRWLAVEEGEKSPALIRNVEYQRMFVSPSVTRHKNVVSSVRCIRDK